MVQTSNQGDPFTSSLRIATFSIAAFDVLQTIPGEFLLYRKQIRNRRLSLVCFLFIIVRYVSILSLVLNAVGFYATGFHLESCRKFRLAPPVTKMIAGMACQGIIFLRTWAITRKSQMVLIVLGMLFVVCLPLMIIGNVYKRAPHVKNGSCIAKQVPGTFNSAPMYYAAMAVFDLVACVVATISLMQSNKGSMSGFTRRVLKHGLIYAFATTFSNIIVFIALCHVKYIEKIGAFFSVAVTLIMAQHLVLATQNFNDDSSTTNYSSCDPVHVNRGLPPSKALQSGDSGRMHMAQAAIVVPGGGGRQGRTFGTDTFGLGVRVQTDSPEDILSKAESRTSTDVESKDVPAQYDTEHGYGQYGDVTHPYARDAKSLR